MNDTTTEDTIIKYPEYCGFEKGKKVEMGESANGI